MMLVRCAIGNPTLTAIANLARELDTLNRELTAPGMSFPALPTTDPHNSADIAIVKSYVTTIAPLLKKRSLAHAKTVAEGLVLHRIA